MAKKETQVEGVKFRSRKPSFRFRYAAGRGDTGKLVFTSSADTVVSDPALIQQCRNYCQGGDTACLIEIRD